MAKVTLPTLTEKQIAERFTQVSVYVKESPRGSAVGPGNRILFWVYRDAEHTAFYMLSGRSFVIANDKFAVTAIPGTSGFINTPHGANYRIGQSVRSLPCVAVNKLDMKKYVKQLAASESAYQ